MKRQTIKTNNTMKKSTRKDKNWMRNPDQLKTRKLYNITVERNPDSSFRLVGGMNRVLIRKNQHSAEWVNVDTRDLCTELRNSKFHSF